MSKAVLISIRPKWCALIANGEKTVEVRKTRPKIEPPFKCYIYCTKPKFEHEDFIVIDSVAEKAKAFYGGGMVIGEFVCDRVFPLCVKYSDPNSSVALKECPYVCMTDKEIMDYLGNGKTGYGWHISALQIYDEPKELREFRVPELPLGLRYEDDSIKRPPMSWCYVEELRD